MRRSEMTLCATCGLMHRSKKQLHSITSSARCWRNQGASRPSALAVLRLMTSSNLLGRSMGIRTRLSCRTFAANAVRLQLHALAYNLGNFLRTLATPEPIKDWSLTSLKEKLIKIGGKVVSHGRYVVFQMAEVAIPRQMFQEILRLIAELRPPCQNRRLKLSTIKGALQNASRCQ